MRLNSVCLQPTRLSWLPVLSNVAPPSLCRKAATENMLQIIEVHPNWPVYAAVFEHPPPRLVSRCPIWSDMTSVDTITQWREDWSSASVVNHTIVTTLVSYGLVSICLVTHGRWWTISSRSRHMSCELAQMGSHPITTSDTPVCVVFVVELLHKFSIRAADGPQKLLKVSAAFIFQHTVLFTG